MLTITLAKEVQATKNMDMDMAQWKRYGYYDPMKWHIQQLYLEPWKPFQTGIKGTALKLSKEKKIGWNIVEV